MKQALEGSDIGKSLIVSMQKDAIAASLSKRMDELAALEEEARNETDGLKKGVLLAQCRMVRDLPLANCQDEFL